MKTVKNKQRRSENKKEKQKKERKKINKIIYRYEKKKYS